MIAKSRMEKAHLIVVLLFMIVVHGSDGGRSRTRGMIGSDGTIPSASSGMFPSAAGGMIPAGGRTVSTSGMLPGGGVYSAGAGVLPATGMMPSAGGMMPSAGGMMPSAGRMMSSARGMMPSAGMIPVGGFGQAAGGVMGPMGSGGFASLGRRSMGSGMGSSPAGGIMGAFARVAQNAISEFGGVGSGRSVGQLGTTGPRMGGAMIGRK